jgi:hypothetical protein
VGAYYRTAMRAVYAVPFVLTGTMLVFMLTDSTVMDKKRLILTV